MPIFGAKSRAARGCASKLACGRRIDPCGRHDRFYETLRQNGRAQRADRGVRPYRTLCVFADGVCNFAIAPCWVDVGIDPYGDFALSPFVVQFCDCILRGRGKPRSYVTTKLGGRFCFDFRPERW